MSGQPELVCNRCEPAEAENARLRQALQSMQAEADRLADEIREGHETRRLLEGRVRKLKADLTQATNTGPDQDKITAIYECWVRVTGHKRAKLTDERRKLIRGQLRTYQAEDLIRAIRGAGLLPYVRYGKRYAVGKSDEVSTQLEDCIGPKPPARVEKNIDAYKRACRAAAEQREQMWSMYQRVTAHQSMWASMMLDAATASENGIPVDDLERHLWDRLEQDDQFWAQVLTVDAPAEPDLSNVVPIRRDAA